MLEQEYNDASAGCDADAPPARARVPGRARQGRAGLQKRGAGSRKLIRPDSPDLEISGHPSPQSSDGSSPFPPQPQPTDLSPQPSPQSQEDAPFSPRSSPSPPPTEQRLSQLPSQSQPQSQPQSPSQSPSQSQEDTPSPPRPRKRRARHSLPTLPRPSHFYGKRNNTSTLFRAARCEPSDEQLELASCLVDAGCNVNHIGKRGKSCLMIATEKNNLPLAKLLLESGADPFEWSNDAGIRERVIFPRSAVSRALELGHRELLSLFLERLNRDADAIKIIASAARKASDEKALEAVMQVARLAPSH